MSHFLTLTLGASKVSLADYSLIGKGKAMLNAYGSCELASTSPDMLSTTLVPAIHKIMRENAIRPAPVVVSLSGQKVIPKYVKIFNQSNQDKLLEDVRIEIEQAVPFPIDDIVYDSQFLGETDDGYMATLIVASKLEEVRPVTDAVRQAGLKVVAVDASPMAIYNAARASYSPDDGCTLVLDIGTKTTDLVIVEGSRFYNRTISVAGATITKEIAQSFGCSLEEAEELKIDRGYVSLGGVTEDDDEISDRVSKVIRTVVTRIHAEISRSVNFYRSQQGGSAPTRLVLTGGSSRIPQLDEFFASTLQIEVEYLNPFSLISTNPKLQGEKLEDDAFIFAESAGLALRYAGLAPVKIDLMPPELIEEAKDIKRIPFIAAGVVSVLVALALCVVSVGSSATLRQEKAEALSSLNASRDKWKKKMTAAEKEGAVVAAECNTLQQLIWERTKTISRLNAVRDSLVPGMWIKEWTPIAPKMNNSGDKNAAAPVESVVVTIRGWNDIMSKVTEFRAANSGKNMTPAEIVQNALKGKSIVVADSIKVTAQRLVGQKDGKGGLVEFSLQMNFAQPPTILSEEKVKGKKR